MKFAITLIVAILALGNLGLASMAFVRLRQPTSIALWAMKVFFSAITPLMFLVGLSLLAAGWALQSLWIILPAGLSAILCLIHIFIVTRTRAGVQELEYAFGPGWQGRLAGAGNEYSLQSGYRLTLPACPEPILQQNVVFHTLAESNRELLCDIWTPAEGVQRSGLAFLYLHGSAWTVLDKDYGTRVFFRHLAAQGHTIMDVAYRLFPETDMMGMVHDAKHAIGWLKDHAGEFAVDPQRIVIGGGSAGAHIAMLAAYTAGNPDFAPDDLAMRDGSVRGVVSLYGPCDLESVYYHTCQHLTEKSSLSRKQSAEEDGVPPWIERRMGADFHRLGFDKAVEPGMLRPMLGGGPEEIKAGYDRFSPINHVHAKCPPTLLLQGEHDILVPAASVKKLHARLRDQGVPVVGHFFAKTDHAFDLILPKISPAAHRAYYHIERFLALLA